MKPIHTNSNIQPHKYQHGLTLIEVMIAITISLILLAGVMQIFTGSRQTYRVQDNMARLQENGRFAMSFLTRGVRASDYWGCLTGSTPATVINNLNPAGVGFVAFNGAGGIAGTDNTGLNGSDTLTLNTIAPVTGLTIVAPFMGTNPAANIQVAPAANSLQLGDIVMVGDCESIDIFQIQAGTPGVTGTLIHGVGVPVGGPPAPPAGPGNLTGLLSKPYTANRTPSLLTSQAITYSIQPDPANNNEPSLFQSVNGGIPVVLVEGVENMQIRYGENTTAPAAPPAISDLSADRYVPAGTTLPVALVMGNVVSVRISLVMRTQENNVSTSVQPYDFNGAVVTPTDRRLRRVFSTTISLRNRGQ